MGGGLKHKNETQKHKNQTHKHKKNLKNTEKFFLTKWADKTHKKISKTQSKFFY